MTRSGIFTFENNYQVFCLACVVGELYRVDRIDVEAEKLQRENGALVSHVAVNDVGLDTAGGDIALCE